MKSVQNQYKIVKPISLDRQTITYNFHKNLLLRFIIVKYKEITEKKYHNK